MKKRKNFAILRGAAAVVLALLLLVLTGFGAFRLMAGPETVTDSRALQNGAYVRVDLSYVMDVIGVEKNSAGAITAYYAAAPVGDQFVTIRFPASDAEHMLALEEATDAYLQGRAASIPFHMTVSGAARHMTEDTAALMAQWFGENATWMSQAGVITAVTNYGDYLSGVMIDTAGIGSVSVTAAVTAAVIAAALLIYAVAEFVLAGLGRYDKPRKKKEEDAHG